MSYEKILPYNLKKNQYPTYCEVCKTVVPANHGPISKNQNGKWRVVCGQMFTEVPRWAQ